jgi:hypothetical protein
MGRRAKNVLMVRRIKINIGPHVETFELEDELLSGRTSALGRVREIRQRA